jgi:hypothetical protein
VHVPQGSAPITVVCSPLPASVAPMQHVACACLHTMWGHHAEGGGGATEREGPFASVCGGGPPPAPPRRPRARLAATQHGAEAAWYKVHS